MNFRLVFKLTGKTLLVEAAAMLLPLLVCLLYRENPLPFLITIPLIAAVGLILAHLRSDDHFFPREGFFAVALIWLLVGALGALPFFFWGRLYPELGLFRSYIDCFFESVSGFTTTGASILSLSLIHILLALVGGLAVGRKDIQAVSCLLYTSGRFSLPVATMHR